jgi:hypothetical protein
MPAGFRQTNTCGTGVLPGKTCQISVRFTPSAKGLITGAMRIDDNAINTPQTVSVSGTGT